MIVRVVSTKDPLTGAQQARATARPPATGRGRPEPRPRVRVRRTASDVGGEDAQGASGGPHLRTA
eukprot:1488507-Pleurochrysis_carterae.AAC.1